MNDNHIPILKLSLTGPGMSLLGQGTFGKVYADGDYVYKKIKIIAENENEISIIENNIRELSFYKLIMEKSSFTSQILLPEIPSCIPIPTKISYVEPYAYIHMHNYGVPLHHLHYTDKDMFKHIFKQVIEGIFTLNKSNMSHGDLKAGNILVDKNNNVKLIDYGSVYFYHSKYLRNSYQRCTIFYASPEELVYEKYSKYNDWWSLGVIMYEFCTRKCFMEALFRYLKIDKTKYEVFLDYAYTRNNDLHDDAKDFIVTFYSNLNSIVLNNFITHTVKDKEIQLYLMHLLKIDPDERNIQEIVYLFNCKTPVIKEVNIKSSLIPFIETPSLTLKTRAESIQTIFILSYQISEFGEEIIGHSIMLFDRFFLRTRDEVHDPKIYCIISMFITSSILKGELIKGTYIKKIFKLKYNEEYYLEDIRRYISTFITALDFKLFNFSPDILHNFTNSYDTLLELSMKYSFSNDNAYELFKLLK